jgi:hypothetical protein
MTYFIIISGKANFCAHFKVSSFLQFFNQYEIEMAQFDSGFIN